MKILYLHQFDLGFAGGSGIYLRAVCEGLRGLGHEPMVVSARCPDPYGYTVRSLPFDFTLTFGPEKRAGEVAITDFSAADLESMASRLVDHIAGNVDVPDLLLVNHASLMALAAARLARKWKVPFRIISHGTDTKVLQRSTEHLEILRPAVRDAERVFAVSTFVATELLDLGLCARPSVLGGAVDRSIFRHGPGPNGGPARVAFVGRLVTEKGLWTLLRAFERIESNVELAIVGEGPIRDAVARHVASSRSGARIELTGYLRPSAVRDVLAGATFTVVPSTWSEPLGLVVLESLACGTPVIASDVGGIPESIRHLETGLLVPAGDEVALASAMDRLLGDADLRASMREAVARTNVPGHADLAARVIA